MGKRTKAALHITEVTRQSQRFGKVGPILTSFHHAPLDASCLSSGSPTVNLSVKSWKDDKPMLDLDVSTPEMTYSNEAAPKATPHFITYLAIRDKESGKTRLVETNSTVLKPQVSVPESKNPTIKQESVDAPTLAQKIEASKHLIKQFGQKKGSRFYEQQERMKIDSSQTEERAAAAAAGVDMERVGGGLPPTSSPFSMQQTEELLPPRDESAKDENQVYRVDRILTNKELDSLKEAANQVLEKYDNINKLKEAQKSKDLSGMGVKLLSKMLETGNPDLSQAAALLYLEGIIKFSRVRIGELRKGVRTLQSFLPMIIRQKILDSFSATSGSDRVRSPELEDKARCHAIVLGLLVNDLSMEVADLTESIWVRSDHLKKLVSLVGARMIGDPQSQGQKIVLKLPLTTFKMEMMRKRTKK